MGTAAITFFLFTKEGFQQFPLFEFEKSFEGQEIPCPETWGGYHLIPEEFEFWFGRDGRLHERFVYQSEGSNWRRFMRSP